MKFLIAFLLFVPNLIFASSAIEEARKSVLEGNRGLAIDQLKAHIVIVKGKKRSQAINFLDRVTKMFIKESAQRLYQSADSKFYTDIELATKRLSEAHKIEPLNLTVLLSLGRAKLKVGACGQSDKLAIEAITIQPYSEEAKLLRLQSLVCLGEFDEFELLLKEAVFQKKETKLLKDILYVQSLLFRGQLEKGRAEIDKIVALDPSCPEGWLWNAEVSKAQGRSSKSAGEAYLRSCRKLRADGFRRYRLEPRICSQESKIEALVKEENSKGES